MIDEINMLGVAAFQNESSTISGLKKINYFFGANGTGKTCISRVISNQSKYPTTQLMWKNGTALDGFVYNRDFVNDNFSQTDLPGVFTLGKENINLEDQIGQKRAECNALFADITRLRNALDGSNGEAGKTQERKMLENDFEEVCWLTKKEFEDQFNDVLGSYSRKNAFMLKVLEEHENNDATLKDISYLDERSQLIFGEAPKYENIIRTPVLSSWNEPEGNTILQKVIIGKNDLNITALIDKLGNSDWVRQGIGYLDESADICPFCQQTMDASMKETLEAYFDEAFRADVSELTLFTQSYKAMIDRLLEELNLITQMDNGFIDNDNLRFQVDNLRANIRLNEEALARKEANVSTPVKLMSLDEPVSSVLTTLKQANNLIAEHNTIVENLEDERLKLIAQVWRLVTEKLRSNIESYLTNSQNVQNAIENLHKQIEEKSANYTNVNRELEELEKRVTSIKPTVEKINQIIQSSGFTGFNIDTTKDETAYRLVRDDGQLASETLSEGEKNLVSFLYFYCLLDGSFEASGTSSDRIVVIDDPVSSLDSDVIFLVSSLIRGITERVRDDSDSIKQLILLSHNVSFHKEVSYESKRQRGKCLNDETFWLVRKRMGVSTVECVGNNPVSTEYSMLWDNLKKQDSDILTIRNTMRRILESYFQLIGGIATKELPKSFEGEELFIARSLLTWLHAGSHSAFDDELNYSDATVDQYKAVFEKVFELNHQDQHYNMMMENHS